MASGTQRIGDWDFLNKHVDASALSQGNEGSKRGNYVSSESIVLCAGPSTLSAAGTLENVVPIGVCDTIQVMQNKGVITLYEIGSRIPYIIPGRPVTQFQISRVLFNGDSLLAALTYGSALQGESDPSAYDNSVMGGPGSEFTFGAQDADHTGKFYMNLASHFFNAPFGLALFFKDSEQQWVAGFYAENCVLQQHSMAIQGQNMVVMENAGVRCTTFIPIPSGS
jgi:hypothetical protein